MIECDLLIHADLGLCPSSATHFDPGKLISLNLSFFSYKNRMIKIILCYLVYRAVMVTKGNNSCKELKLGAWHRKCS